MQLHWQRPDSHLFVRRLDGGRITVVDREFDASFVLSPERVVERWPVDDVRRIDDAALDAIVALQPEVVLIGSGARIAFPEPRVMAYFLTRRIGVEVMDNAAAARTFNVLADEGRRVVAAFILPPQPA